MGGVPVEAEVLSLLGPTLAPMADSPLSPRASKASAFTPAPESDTTTDLTPAFPPMPTTTSGVRPVLTPPPSAASSHISKPAISFAIAGMMNFNRYY
ncbi:hypothetical protein ACOSP7_001483 [Xanthoceras sorbifolium]|uniref:Uncharacterized protein n=1 Tax=Xanthoceras sorbifolium TaxID=99658 RepID=A0ABQ8ILV8_9ROSI|nr:hypothetical protein JRO89_XS01G0268700 [Xanthoceras sorbifolium]